VSSDPNEWSDDPRYIIQLLKRIVTVSLKTMKIVDDLPPRHRNWRGLVDHATPVALATICRPM